ncbi:MAG TPA: alpha/beta hydrolase-fold protein, partial [Propionibacteriaceae bacterium]|nr:alpha/beta hydrolase-fold protein [Propionibacteriaceae bacterium]
MSQTGLPLFVLLVALALLIPLVLTISWRRRPHGLGGQILRFIAMVTAQLMTVAAVAIWANNTFGFYDNWADLLGDAGTSSLVAQTNGLLPAGGAEGRVVTLTVRGNASAGIVLVWLPPQYDQPALKNKQFPVLMMMPGQPGTPEGVFSQFQFAQQATQAIRSGAVQPFVAVFPPLMIAPPRDTECTNVPGGPQAETWLSHDVRNAVLKHFRVSPDGRQWSAAGWSTGGFCAAKLLLRHPAQWHAAAAIGGYFDAETDPSTGNLFAGSAQLRRENSPIWLIRQPKNLNAHLLIVVSKTDRHSYDGVHYADSKQMINQTKSYPNVSTLVLPSGGHNYTVYGRTLPPVLAWCA